MRAANRRISENLSLMEFDPTGFGHGGRGQGPNYERLRRLASRWWSANTEERRLRAEGELEALGYEIHELETGQQGVQLTPYGNYHIDDVVEFLVQDLYEAWSQKYKKSINCSHPKGFSQKAHCAGKKKHNESHEVMEHVCPDCGMCESHSNMTLSEIAKGAKDSNGFTKCWPGKHAVGTKKGKNGGQVRNCQPNESVEQGVAEGLEPEGSTFKNSLHTIIRVATHLEKQMGDDENFPEWESEMVGSVKDQMVKIMDYEISKKEQQGVAEDFKQPMKMADYVAQADRLHDEMMRCQHANDEAGYERAKQQYLALERQARQGMIPETAGTTAATMPPSPAAAAQAKAIVQKAADDRAVSLANMARVVPNNVAEDSGAWPFQEINELSNDKLAQYKSAAGRAATAADRAGNYELGNKRFRGITQATKKQFANDVKKHRPQ